MSDARSHVRSAYWGSIAVLASVAAMSQAEGSWLPIAVAAAAMAAGLALDRKGRPLSAHWRLPLGLAVLILFVLDFLFYSKGVIVTFAHVMVLTMSVYLLTAKKWADWLWLLAQALMLISAAAVASFEIAFIFYSAVFMLAACLFGCHMTVERAADGASRASTWFAARRGAREAAFATVAVLSFLAAGTAIYLLVPRVRPFGFTTPFLKAGEPVTGFSPRVELDNGVGDILQNTTPVFRAQITANGVTGESPVPLYWRGTTLVHFTGTGWATAGTRAPFGARMNDVALPLEIGRHRRRALGPVEVVQSITLERLSTDAMFALPGIISVESPIMRVIRFNIVTDDLAKEPRLQVAGPLAYEVTSRPAFPGDFLNGPDVGDMQDDYMDEALDVSRVSQQISDLAHRVVGPPGRRGSPAALTPYERAVALRDFLKANYEYSLVKTEIPGPSPVDDFLFRTKKGHCEYFASALALMLRTVGVPSRVVNGFLEGEYNQIGRYYTVRESNAHSWTEVYFAGMGWYIFDATPAAEGGGGRGGTLKAIVDYVTYRWLGRIAGYSIDSQRLVYGRLIDLQRRIYGRVRPFADRIIRPLNDLYRHFWRLAVTRNPDVSDIGRGPTVTLLLVLLAACAVFLTAAVVGWLARTVFRLRRAGRESVSAYPRFYRLFVMMLKQRGVTRRIDETPLDAAMRAVAKGVVDRRVALSVVEAYYRRRFAGVELSREEVSRLDALVDAARRRL